MMLDGVAVDVRMWLHHLKEGTGIDLATGKTPLKVMHEAEEFAAEPSLEEAADVFISLIAACTYFGWHPDDLARAARDKMEINKKRSWTQLPDGTYQHS